MLAGEVNWSMISRACGFRRRELQIVLRDIVSGLPRQKFCMILNVVSDTVTSSGRRLHTSVTAPTIPPPLPSTFSSSSRSIVIFSKLFSHCLTRLSLVYLTSGGLCTGVSPRRRSMLFMGMSSWRAQALRKSCRTSERMLLLPVISKP